MSTPRTRTRSRRPPLRLLELFAARGVSHSAYARKLGVPRSTLLSWLHGQCSPLPDLRARLEAQLRADGFDPRIALTPRGQTAPSPAPPSPDQEEEEMLTREYLSFQVLERFSLSDDPFDDSEALTDGFLTPESAGVLKMMSRAVMNRQIIAITGEPGAGKSTLLRLLAARTASEANIRLIMPATLDRRAINANTLAIAVLRELTSRDTSSLASEARAVALAGALAVARKDGLFPALVIDEAHELSPACLLAVKQIWDRNDLYRGLAVILVGQPPLANALRKDATVRELAARTRLVELPSVERHVADYLRWRFKHVGADADKVFAADAYTTIAKAVTLPLHINNLAARSMKVACAVGDMVVTSAHIGRPLRGVEAA